MSRQSQRPPSARARSICFDDLVPKKQIHGGKADGKVLFGTIDYSAQEDLYGVHPHESNPDENPENQTEGDRK